MFYTVPINAKSFVILHLQVKLIYSQKSLAMRVDGSESKQLLRIYWVTCDLSEPVVYTFHFNIKMEERLILNTEETSLLNENFEIHPELWNVHCKNFKNRLKKQSVTLKRRTIWNIWKWIST